MLDQIIQLGLGFLHCLAPMHLAMLTIGIVIGLLIGVLPGLTLVMGVVLALPVHLRHGRHRLDRPADGDVRVRHLRRRIHVDPVPHSRRADRRADAVGRLHDGAARPAGQGARLDACCGARRRPHLRDHHGAADRSRSPISR